MQEEQPIDENELHSIAAETITEKPHTIDIEIRPKGKFHKFLMWLKLSPTSIRFEIKPQLTQNIYRIAGKAVKIDLGKLFQTEDNVGVLMDIMARHGEDIFYITATALQNNHLEPTEHMINIVKENFTNADIFDVLAASISNYNISAFTNSIALIVGIDALKTNEKVSLIKTGV